LARACPLKIHLDGSVCHDECWGLSRARNSPVVSQSVVCTTSSSMATAGTYLWPSDPANALAGVNDFGVRLTRFELVTPGFVGRCSIQMSYSRNLKPTRMPCARTRVK
jgi:hypothetical protein